MLAIHTNGYPPACAKARLSEGKREADIEQAAIDGAVQRLRPKLMAVTAVILSLARYSWRPAGSDVMPPIAAPIVGGMITSTILVLILIPVFFLLLEEASIATWNSARRGLITCLRL
jgi:copper/silver efflux system protein